jgi:hypothetical protein
MEDDQTGSLWSQISGECIKGEMLGKKLELYPAQYSTFGAEKEKPGVEFLVKPERGPNHSPYKDYFEDRGKFGVFGTIFNDTLLEGKELVYGLRTIDYQVAVPKSLFTNQSAYTVSLGNLDILLIAGGNGQLAGYNLPPSENSDWKLEFKNNQVIVNKGDIKKPYIFANGAQTGGESLQRFPVITAYWFAWRSFFPDGEVFQP